MIYLLIGVVIGIVIGWNWIQPPWARDIQARVAGSLRSFIGKSDR